MTCIYLPLRMIAGIRFGAILEVKTTVPVCFLDGMRSPLRWIPIKQPYSTIMGWNRGFFCGSYDIWRLYHLLHFAMHLWFKIQLKKGCFKWCHPLRMRVSRSALMNHEDLSNRMQWSQWGKVVTVERVSSIWVYHIFHATLQRGWIGFVFQRWNIRTSIDQLSNTSLAFFVPLRRRWLGIQYLHLARCLTRLGMFTWRATTPWGQVPDQSQGGAAWKTGLAR